MGLRVTAGPEFQGGSQLGFFPESASVWDAEIVLTGVMARQVATKTSEPEAGSVCADYDEHLK
jgi:hypothetical protein